MKRARSFMATLRANIIRALGQGFHSVRTDIDQVDPCHPSMFRSLGPGCFGDHQYQVRNMKALALLTGALLAGAPLTAQDFTVVPEESSVVIRGTSTLHDWESDLEEFSLEFTRNEGTVDKVLFKAPVKAIKSGKKAMDENTYQAMKAEKFPFITFEGSGFRLSGHQIFGKGTLTVAGVARAVEVTTNVESWVTGIYDLVGELKLRMTDHGIDPPTAMFGTIRTVDEITLVYHLVVKH